MAVHCSITAGTNNKNLQSIALAKWVLLSIEDLFQVSKSIKLTTHIAMNDGKWQPSLMILYQTVQNAFAIALEPEKKTMKRCVHRPRKHVELSATTTAKKSQLNGKTQKKL